MYARPVAVSPSSWMMPGWVFCTRNSTNFGTRSPHARICSWPVSSTGTFGIRSAPSGVNSDATRS